MIHGAVLVFGGLVAVDLLGLVELVKLVERPRSPSILFTLRPTLGSLTKCFSNGSESSAMK
jgi:hypothetical protein